MNKLQIITIIAILMSASLATAVDESLTMIGVVGDANAYYDPTTGRAEYYRDDQLLSGQELVNFQAEYADEIEVIDARAEGMANPQAPVTIPPQPMQMAAGEITPPIDYSKSRVYEEPYEIDVSRVKVYGTIEAPAQSYLGNIGDVQADYDYEMQDFILSRNGVEISAQERIALYNDPANAKQIEDVESLASQLKQEQEPYEASLLGEEPPQESEETKILTEQQEKGPEGVTPPAQEAPKVPAGWHVLGGADGGVTLALDENDKLRGVKEDGTAMSDDEYTAYMREHPSMEINAEQLKTNYLASRPSWISTYIQYYNAYAGLAGYSSLIFDADFLKTWRQTVNDIFCNKALGYLPLSRDCWTSTVCGVYTEITPSPDGVLFTAPEGGVPAVSAHIEGTRSLPIVTPNATYWVYTVTFSMTNPLEKSMSYNVNFGGERVASWWSTDQSLGEGSTAAATGAAALSKMSSYDYREVCLTFDPALESFGGKRVDKICNDIVQYSGGATAPYTAVTGNQTSAQGTTAGSTTGWESAIAPGASI
jgi:hypothetical protein